MNVPGFIYSALLALGAWALMYFDVGGDGSGFYLAPLILAAVPMVIKAFSVATTDAETPAAMPMTRGPSGAPVAVKRQGKVSRLLLG